MNLKNLTIDFNLLRSIEKYSHEFPKNDVYIASQILRRNRYGANLTQASAQERARNFFRIFNHRCSRDAKQIYDRKVASYCVIGNDSDGLLHISAAIQNPFPTSPTKFRNWVKKAWFDAGFVNYTLKIRKEKNIERWIRDTSSVSVGNIDWTNCNLPRELA